MSDSRWPFAILDTVTSGVGSVVGSAVSAVGGVIETLSAGGGAQEPVEETEMAEKVGGHEDWEMVSKGIGIVHDEQHKPINQENEKDRDEETHNLKEECIAYENRIIELEKTVNEKDRLVLTLRDEARAIKIRSEAEISKLKQQLSEEKRPKNQAATSGGSASEIRDYKEHSKKQSQVIRDLKQDIKELKSHLDSGMESYHRQVEEIEEERDKLREDFASSRAELKVKDETMNKLGHELVMVKKEAFESQQLIEKLKEDLETEKAKAEVFKADFNEERRDREQARGALDKLRKQLDGHKLVVNEEVAVLNKEVLLYKEQTQKLNAKNVKLAEESASYNQVILQLKKQVEQSTRELSEQKRVSSEEAKKWREDLQKKKKEIELLEKQSKRSTASMLQLHNKIEKLEKEIKEERRIRKNAEERIKKLDERNRKSKTTRQISATQQFSSVPEQTLVHVQQQYDENIAHTLELNRKIEELEEEVTRLKRENESACGHHSNKYKPPTSPAEIDSSGIFDNDPNFIHSENQEVMRPRTSVLQMRKLEEARKWGADERKQFSAAKHLPSPLDDNESGTAGMGGDLGPNALENHMEGAPVHQVMERDINNHPQSNGMSSRIQKSVGSSQSKNYNANFTARAVHGRDIHHGVNITTTPEWPDPFPPYSESSPGVSNQSDQYLLPRTPLLPQDGPRPFMTREDLAPAQYKEELCGKKDSASQLERNSSQIDKSSMNFQNSPLPLTKKKPLNTETTHTQTSLYIPSNSEASSQTPTETTATQTSLNKPDIPSTADEKEGQLSTTKGIAVSSQSKEAAQAVESTENRLVDNIDNEINEMAAGVLEEVSKEREHLFTMQLKPFDPNLVCPMCAKKHRIGDIQKFRLHVDQCDGND